MIFMTFTRLIFLLTMMYLLVACGQRGPLFLPDENAAPIASQPVPDELKTEREADVDVDVDVDDEDILHEGSFEDEPENDL